MDMKLVTIAGMLALTACSTPGRVGESDPDGVACRDSAGATAVHIDVEYSGGVVGTPTPTCEVDPGTTITWRTAVGTREGFHLRFDEASPGGRGAPLEPSSTERDGRQKIVLTADNASGTYRYEILTRDGGVDPAIIIRRIHQ